MLKQIEKFWIKHINGDRRDWVWPNYALDDPFGSASVPAHSDPVLAWSFLKGYHGKDFNLNLINFYTKTYTPEYNFKSCFIDWQNKKDSWIWYKYMWLINDYYDGNKKLKYPIQMNYHYRKFSWRAHPGVLRYNIFHIDGKESFEAFYQPVSNKKVEIIKRYYELEDLSSHWNVDLEKIWIKLCWFYGKPYVQLNLFYTHETLGDHVSYWLTQHKNIFHENIKDGIFIDCDSKTEKKIKKEIDQWPDKTLADKVKFEKGDRYIHLEDFKNENLYYGLLMFGTKLKNINVPNAGLYYQTA
jgi:hypothetical protein